MTVRDYPGAERIATVLILAAIHMDELSAWVKADERVLRGEVEIRSRWIALAALAAIYPRVSVAVLGRYVGPGDGPALVRRARVEPWWDDRLVEQVMVEALSLELPRVVASSPAALGALGCVERLLRHRMSIINRRASHVG